jgi:hypothetical protein
MSLTANVAGLATMAACPLVTEWSLAVVMPIGFYVGLIVAVAVDYVGGRCHHP